MADTKVREAVGVFHDEPALQAAVDELLDAGFEQADLSLLAGHQTIERKLGHYYEKVAEIEDDPSVPRRAFVDIDTRTEAKGSVIGGLAYVGAVAAAGMIVASGGKVEEPLLSMGTNNGTDRSNVAYFGTVTLQPGTYDAVLSGPDGAELARAPFWLLAPGALPALTVDKADYTAGEPITVKWQNAPGHRRDWLGIYKAGDPDQWNYLAFLYTSAASSGEAVFDEAAIGGALDGGEYEIRLMRDDAYMVLGAVPFSVSAPP